MARNNKGFTLIELMIVFVIIGILSAVAIPAYMEYNKKMKGGHGEAKTLTIGQYSIKVTLKYPYKWNDVIESVDNVSPKGGRPEPITPPAGKPISPTTGVTDGGTLTPKL